MSRVNECAAAAAAGLAFMAGPSLVGAVASALPAAAGWAMVAGLLAAGVGFVWGASGW